MSTAVGVLAAGIVSQDLRGELHGGRAVAVAPSHIRKSPQHQEIRAAQALTLDKDRLVSNGVEVAAVERDSLTIVLACQAVETCAPGLVTSTRKSIEGSHVDGDPRLKVQPVHLAIVDHRHSATNSVTEHAVQRVEKTVKGLRRQRYVGLWPDLRQQALARYSACLCQRQTQQQLLGARRSTQADRCTELEDAQPAKQADLNGRCPKLYARFVR